MDSHPVFCGVAAAAINADGDCSSDKDGQHVLMQQLCRSQGDGIGSLDWTNT